LKGGPQHYSKTGITPARQRSDSRSRPISKPTGRRFGQKHGHLNSAVFFVIKGRGYDIHDGRRIDWKAGDIMIVETGCVHQHSTMIRRNEAVLLVFKAKRCSLHAPVVQKMAPIRRPRFWKA